MKNLKKAISILLSVVCLFALAIFVLNNSNYDTNNISFCESVEQLCSGFDEEGIFIESGATKSEILTRFLGDSNSAMANVLDAEAHLNDEEIVELCLANNMVALEAENGFEVYRKFQLKQLIVNGFIDEFYGAQKVAVCFEDVYVLQYETEEQTEHAYNMFKQSNVQVSISQIIKTSYTTSSSYNSWGAERMNVDLFQEYLNTNGTSEEVVVAVLDTGINTAHEIFANRLLKDGNGRIVGTSYCTSKYTYSGYDFEDDNIENGSPKGHGTHVAGIIADLTPENVKILPIKVMDNKGAGTSTDIIAGLEKIYTTYSKDYNIVCANLSLGGKYNTEIEANELNSLFDTIFTKLRNRGVLSVVAAGNEKINTKYTWPSGCKDTAIVVSALTNTYSGMVFDLSYSNYGNSVDISAPGTSITSASIGRFSYVKDSDAYLMMSGTSMAAPHVAAMVALINIDANFMKSNPTCSEIEDRLLSMTEDLGPDGFDVQYGYGALCYKADELEDIPNFETEIYIIENTAVYYDGNYHNINVVVKNVKNYTIRYGFSPYMCNIENITTDDRFLNKTNGDTRVYFRITAEGVDIIDFGILNIKPRPVKIKINNVSVVYGEGVNLNTVGYSVLSGDVISGDDLDVKLDCDVEKYSKVGDYFITATSRNKNYNLSYEKGELTIQPRVLRIRLKDQNNFTASDLEIEQDKYEIVVGELVNDDDLCINIYTDESKITFNKKMKLSAESYNENYDITFEDSTLYVKCSYLEIVSLIACVVIAVLVIVKISQKKNK